VRSIEAHPGQHFADKRHYVKLDTLFDLRTFTFRLTLSPDWAASGGVSLQTENDAQRRVNAAHFVVAEKSDPLAESGRIYCCDLFCKYPGTDVTELYFGPKARGARRGGRRCDKPG
jgi:hypothetical protein